MYLAIIVKLHGQYITSITVEENEINAQNFC